VSSVSPLNRIGKANVGLPNRGKNKFVQVNKHIIGGNRIVLNGNRNRNRNATKNVANVTTGKKATFNGKGKFFGTPKSKAALDKELDAVSFNNKFV